MALHGMATVRYHMKLCNPTTVFSGVGVIGIEAAPGIEGQKESEARVGLDDPGLSIDSATLVQVQLTPRLQHGVQPVKDCGIAQVGTVQQNPFACFNSSRQSTVHPLKPASPLHPLTQELLDVRVTPPVDAHGIQHRAHVRSKS